VIHDYDARAFSESETGPVSTWLSRSSHASAEDA
jgi:hypothetical protein